MNTLMRYSPGFSGLRNEIDRLFDDFFREGDSEVQPAMWRPNADVSESEDRYILRMDMPGISKNELNIELREGVLTVSGERRSEHEDKKENLHRIERSYGRFVRSFTLPQASDADKVVARMENGVLTVEVPKREESKPRRIEIS